MSLLHINDCTCMHCNGTRFNSRRDFLKAVGSLSLGMVAGPTIAGVLDGDVNNQKSFDKSRAVINGKAKKITILHTADIHAQLDTHDEFFWDSGKALYKKRGGFATLKTMLNTLRDQNRENTIVVDGGDCFQGGGVAALSKGAAIIPLINSIGYDLILPGNWEVAYGKEMMLKDLGHYNANKVCANMFHDTNDEMNGSIIFPPYWIRSFGDVKIGFIGYNDPLTPKRQAPAYSKGIRFTKPEEDVHKYIRLLKEYEGCAMVFLVTHMGLAQQVDLANKKVVEGVDYILGADTHERVRTPIEGMYAKVTEPGAFGSFVAKFDFVFENGKVKDQNYVLLDVDPDKYKPDAEMLKLVEEAKAPYKSKLSKVVGTSKTILVRYFVLENTMDNLLTDAIMWKFNPDVALSNGFRFCPPLLPDPKTGVAEITNDFLWSMMPEDSDAKTGKITGKQLKDWIEKELENVFSKDASKRFGGWVVRFKGMEINFTIRKPEGQRLNSVKIKGEELQEEKIYTIVACERDGDPDDTLCRIKNVQDPKKLNETMHSIIREYLKVHSPVSPVIENRVVATDGEKTMLSQLDGYPYEFR